MFLSMDASRVYYYFLLWKPPVEGGLLAYKNWRLGGFALFLSFGSRSCSCSKADLDFTVCCTANP